MFADSSGKFEVKVRFNLLNGGQKGQAQSIHIYRIALRRGVERRNRLINLTLSIACWSLLAES